MSQSTSHLLMVEPVAFCCNVETAESNSYQDTSTQDATDTIQTAALAEHRGLRDALVDHGVIVTTVKGQAQCPDDLFPNNWVSTHAHDATQGVCVYPMLAPNRRQERRADILQVLTRNAPLLNDYSAHEHEGVILEGTGSIIFDHVNRVAYACTSPRTDAGLFDQCCADLGYVPVAFPANDHTGHPIYHTNVMMFIGTEVAGICSAAIPEPDRAPVMASLLATHHIVELSPHQLLDFCGNALEVENAQGDRYMVMSERARHGFTPEQTATLLAHTSGIISAPLPTIERYGGGSARCMLLQVF